jgi:tetratricopeptide (TPR) repeat protein
MATNNTHSFEPDDRLHSWKEIATFLGRGVRSVQRWEAERGLPVHRTPSGKLGAVYALKSELAEWMISAENAADSGDKAVPTAEGFFLAESDDPVALLPAKEFTAEARAEADGSREPVFAGEKAPELVRAPNGSRVRFLFRNWQRSVVWLCALPVLGAVAVLTMSRIDAHPVDAHPVSERVSTQAHVPDPAAVELYLRGRYFMEKRTAESLEKAVDLYTQAIVRDPSYAQAYSGLADCYNLLREFSAMPPEEAYPRALAAASRAIQLDPNSAEAHNSLAFGTFYWKWDAAAANREFERAILLKPDFAQAHHWYANSLSSQDRSEDALREIETAQRLDPSSTAILASKGFVLLGAGRIEEGRTLLKQLEAEQPNYLPPHLYLAGSYVLHAEDAPMFLEEQKVLGKLSSNPLQATLGSAAVRGYAAGGYQEMLRSMLRVLNKLPNDGEGMHAPAARYYALLGEDAQALESLKTAYEQHEQYVIGVISDPAYSRLKSDPMFMQIGALNYHPSAPSVTAQPNPPSLTASAVALTGNR